MKNWGLERQTARGLKVFPALTKDLCSILSIHVQGSQRPEISAPGDPTALASNGTSTQVHTAPCGHTKDVIQGSKSHKESLWRKVGNHRTFLQYILANCIFLKNSIYF